MELFKFLRRFYRILGVITPKSSQFFSFGWKSLLILLAPLYFCASSLVSMSLEMNAAQSHCKTIIDLSYWAVSAFQGAFVFAITILKMPKMIAVIEKFEEIVRKSKCHQRIGVPKKCLFSVFEESFLYLRWIESRNNPMMQDKYDRMNALIERLSEICYRLWWNFRYQDV